MDLSYRQIKISDTGFLKEMMYESLYVAPGKQPYPQAVLELPELRKYYENWGTMNDFGFVALDHKKPIGIAWARLFPEEMKGYGFVAKNIPELGIALYSQYRNRRIGTKLLLLLLKKAKELGYKSLSLSVSKGNQAIHMYTRLGFQTIKESEEDYIMAIQLLSESI